MSTINIHYLPIEIIEKIIKTCCKKEEPRNLTLVNRTWLKLVYRHIWRKVSLYRIEFDEDPFHEGYNNYCNDRMEKRRAFKFYELIKSSNNICGKFIEEIRILNNTDLYKGTIINIIKACPNLKVLDVGHNKKYLESLFPTIEKNYPQLRVIKKTLVANYAERKIDV